MSGLKRTVAWLLVIAMVLPMLCVGGFASSENSNLRTGKDGYVVVDQNGKETEVDESWEEKFPYGALALENSSLTAKEGGEDIILKVHRLGGTTGKVSAVIQYVPAVTEKTDGESRYSSAISADDIQVKVEDPLPITKYQPWGMDPEPERSKKKLLSKDGEDGEGLPSTILYPDAESDTGVYEWYTKIDDDWEKIELAQGKEMPVGKEELEAYDFRCVYTVKGVRYSTDSYKGERYEKPEEEVIPEAPADLELNPEPEYTELELADGDDLYKGWLFEVCFAEGETEKEIIISAKEDSLVELEEFATFTIADSVGGYVLDSLNTTILCVEDNDEDEPSAIAFSVQEVTVDKSEGVAKVKVERTGGVTKPLTVDWELEEGSALAGEDFADAKGTISFYGEQTEQTIEVQLINNQIEETDKKDFEIVLSNLKGDEGDGSKIESDKASCTVQLYNTNTADELNAASTLYSVDAQDVSANISNTESAEVSSGVISGDQVTADSEMELLSEEETCSIDWGSDDGEEISPLVTNIGKITFRGGNWGPTDSIKLEVSGTGKNEKIYTPLHFRTLYESLHGSVYGGAKLASGWNRFLHGDEEYAYTYFSTKNKYWDCSPRFRKSGLKVYLSAYNPFYVSDSWDYPGYGQNDQDKLSLGIKKFDTQSSEETIHAKTDVNLTRRRIDGSFYLDLYTANDQNIDGVAHYTAENYKEILDPDNGISITEGGQQYGCLYEGSTVQIKLQNTHLTPVEAYVIDKNGGSVYESGSINGNTITFNDLLLPPDKDYVFKVELDRKQDIKINVSYSARVNEDGSYVDNAFAEAYELMKSRNTKSGDITIGYTSLNSYTPSGETQSTKTVSINNKSLSSEGEITISDLKNIQWVNFNLPAEDLIVLNGKAYKGNENIKLELKHLTTKSIYFFYYNEEFLTAQRPMKAVIDATAIYLDNSGNGKIDGYYDEDKGIFIIEEDNGVKDTFVCFMDDGDYEETTFSPIINEDGKICQYFMRPYYTANPVCMTIPSGASDEERMQVMPNFITHITDDNAYAKLTDEQKSYRTIVSGKSRTSKNGKEIYTADGHIKYTAAATAYSYIDIPLGGDTSPARQITSAELGGPKNGSAVINGVDYMFDSGKAYYHDESQGGELGDAIFTWNPKFKGNMLYPFDNPQPIKIPHSIAGDDIPVTTALETWYQKTDGSWTKEAPSGENAPGYAINSMNQYVQELRGNEEGAKALNNYLGAFGGNDSFALVIDNQVNTTDEIISSLNSLSTLDKTEDTNETVTLGTVGVFPNSEYLKKNKSSQTSAESNTEGNIAYEEMSTDFKPELHSFSSEALGYFTVEVDGYEVNFGIGIPVYNSGAEGTGAKEVIKNSAKGPGSDVAEAGSKIGQFVKELRSTTATTGKEKAKNAFGKLAGDELKANNLRSKGLEFSIKVSLGLTFKYSPIDNKFMFSQGAAMLKAGVEFRLQYRFTPVPIIYIYIQLGASLQITTGFSREREVVLGKKIKNSDPLELKQTEQYYFTTDKKAFNMTFNGKMYVECFEFKDGSTGPKGQYDEGDTIGKSLDGFHAGYLSSDGKEASTVILKGMDGHNLDKPVVVVLTVMKDEDKETKATLNDITLVESAKTQIYFDGVRIDIEGTLEAGLGVGIDIAKVEVFFKANVGFGGGYSGTKDKQGIFEFKLGLGLGFRVVLLFFNYEQDLISYSLKYEQEGSDKKWTHSWSALGGHFGDDLGTLEDGLKEIETRITTPETVIARVYGNNVTGAEGEIEEQAFTSNTDNFQVSGYGSSVNAFKLQEIEKLGSDFQVVTVGDANYVVYTGTSKEEGVNNTEIWVSKIEETDDNYGLVNPIAGKGTAAQKYIPVDGDGTGDLDFCAWAEGDNLHVAWVSYADKTSKTEAPKGDAFVDDNNVTMTKDNYKEIQKPELPEKVEEPAEVLEPKAQDYFLTAEEYEKLGEQDKIKYTKDKVDEGFFYSNTYKSYEEAKKAFEAEQAAYKTYTAELEKYNEYKTKKDRYDNYTAWYNYFDNGDPQAQVTAASKNTVVKHAVFNTKDEKAEGFTGKKKTEKEDIYSFLPANAGEAIVYAQSVPYSEEELSQRLESYDEYLTNTMMKSGQSPDGNTNVQVSDPENYLGATKQYRMNYQRAQMEIYGGNSKLTVFVPGKTLTNNVMFVSNHQEDGAGTAKNQTDEILVNMELTEIDGTYYVAYATQQDEFEKEGSVINDILSVTRLYLRTFTIGEDNAVTWGDPFLLRTLVNNEQSNEKDGLYSNSSLKEKYENAYIGGLRFLEGKLGNSLPAAEAEDFTTFADIPSEHFLVFEMNGDTFVIRESSLKSIVTSHTGTINPFFTSEQYYGDAIMPGNTKNLSSNKSEVIIGADGDGNIAAVYTSSVPNSVNNAIYISYWDPEVGSWGEGVMLAMNYMDVYERSVSQGWDAAETENAYFNEEKGGGLTQFTFSELQLALGRAGAASTQKTEEISTQDTQKEVEVEAESAASFYKELISQMGIKTKQESEIDTLADEYTQEEIYKMEEKAQSMGLDTGSKTAANPELLIITQGSLQKLAAYELNDEATGLSTTIYAPKRGDDERVEKSTQGVYAISYGKGGQQIGNANITFGYNEFTVGSQLVAGVSMKNVGDAALRGSSDNPISAKLMLHHDGKDVEIAAWKITENIGAGQEVKLDTKEKPCKPLESNLGTGDYFFVSVEEDASYVYNAYSYRSDNDTRCPYKFNVENKPELAIEKIKAGIKGVTKDGRAETEISFDVTNRGHEKADEVFIQISTTSYDGDGNPIYTPLDLSDSEIYVSQQKHITDELETLGVNDLANGIIYLGTDSKFYTDDYYITKEAYNEILKQYYSETEVPGWEKGVYEGKTYWYDKLYYISAYAAYEAGQKAVKQWSPDSSGKFYYNNSYKDFASAKAAADEARKAEYIRTADQYNALDEKDKEGWKEAGSGYYIPNGYENLQAAESAYDSALKEGASDQNIKSNYCRSVKGIIPVAPEKFTGKLTKSLDLHIEVFSNSSNPSIDPSTGVYTSEHSDEYHSLNNSSNKQLEQATFFSAAPRITLAKGSTHRLPISAGTTTGEVPVISVLEVEDGSDEIATLYYSADADTDGVENTTSGYINIVGHTPGAGVIHLVDNATNTTYPISYVVAEAGSGINIFNDDAQFTFYNKDKANGAKDPVNMNKPNQDWKFEPVSKWRNDNSEPYLGNLSIGKKDAYFTFETKADTISFDLIGEVTVTSSKFPGSKKLSNSEDSATASTGVVDFGNEYGVTHTVTVKVTGGDQAWIDTMRITYSEGTVLPSDDKEAPGLYWDRSFPIAESVKEGEELTFTVYAVDESGLFSISKDGKRIADDDPGLKKINNGLWSYTFKVKANGEFSVSAQDTNGNTTNRNVMADWFASSPSSEERGKSPKLDATIVKKTGDKEEDLYEEGKTVTVTSEEAANGTTVEFKVSTDKGANLTYYGYNEEKASFEKFGEGVKTINRNGYYMVKAEDKTNQTWSQKIFLVECFEATPEITTKQTETNSPNGWKIEWSASKDEESYSRLNAVDVNGISLLPENHSQEASYSGKFNVNYGGKYNIVATDTKGIKGVSILDLSVPVDIHDKAIFGHIDPWGQPVEDNAVHGSISIDFSKVTGGDYTEESAENAKSLQDYKGSYEYVVLSEAEYKEKKLPDGKDGDEFEWLDKLEWSKAAYNDLVTVEDLKASKDGDTEYAVIIRDSLNKQDYSGMAVKKISLKDNAIDIDKLSTRLVSVEGAKDGQIYAEASKGETGYYEFAVLPAKADGTALTAEDFKSEDVKWQIADRRGDGSSAMLEGLGAGDYQVAVRALYIGETSQNSMDQVKEKGDLLNQKENALIQLKLDKAKTINDRISLINIASGEWVNAVDDAAQKEKTYNELQDKLNKGQDGVTEDMVNDAKIALDDAKTAAAEREKDYKTVLALEAEAEAEVLALRSKMIEEAKDESSTAKDEYNAKIREICKNRTEAEFKDDFAKAETELTAAAQDYQKIAEAVSAENAEAYSSNEKLWDGLAVSKKASLKCGTKCELTVSSGFVSSPGFTNGSINAVAKGGSAYDGGDKVHYQYAIIPIENGDGVDYSDNMQQIGQLDLDWQFADNVNDEAKGINFEGLGFGNYQVFARVVYDPYPDDGKDVNSELEGDYAKLLAAYKQAELETKNNSISKKQSAINDLYNKYQSSGKEEDLDAYKKEIDNNAEVLAALDNWTKADSQTKNQKYELYQNALNKFVKDKADADFAMAKELYSAKRDEIKLMVEQAYEDVPGYYDTADVEKAYVCIRILDGISDKYQDDNRVIIHVRPGTELHRSERQEILDCNTDNTVVLISGNRKIVIPKGVLEDGDEVRDVLSDFEGGKGNVVEVELKDGTTKFVPISLAENGEVAYVYMGRGKYKVVESKSSFEDIESHWAKDSILFTADRNLFKGISETLFNPDGTMTRAMLATVLYRMAGEPKVTGNHPFTDVAEGEWYSDAIKWAHENGVVNGMTATEFMPNRYVTREQMVTMVHRYLRSANLCGSERSELKDYGDFQKVSSYAKEAFEWANGAKIVEGTDEGLLMPKDNASRAQMAAIFERIVRYVLR